MTAQPLGLTYKDMIDDASVAHLNAEVKAMLAEHHGQMSAEDALEAVADRSGFLLVERDNETALVRNADGLYATIWYESQFGQAMSVYTPEQYEEDAVGFDNQALGWAETEAAAPDT